MAKYFKLIGEEKVVHEFDIPAILGGGGSN